MKCRAIHERVEPETATIEVFDRREKSPDAEQDSARGVGFEKVLFCPGSGPWPGCLLQAGVPLYFIWTSQACRVRGLYGAGDFSRFLAGDRCVASHLGGGGGYL